MKITKKIIEEHIKKHELDYYACERCGAENNHESDIFECREHGEYCIECQVCDKSKLFVFCPECYKEIENINLMDLAVFENTYRNMFTIEEFKGLEYIIEDKKHYYRVSSRDTIAKRQKTIERLKSLDSKG